ncbi:MCE family protein [Skermania piniformis]|uniref:MCE family protein n=1 Tax=Skermania pinensis TaxID=39122 RepID=A0ABX8S8M0_9ACTN|nr:MCE family protein [Skermania piniformis]QXQ13512.1 MCE family protein [Skermania piniformis]
MRNTATTVKLGIFAVVMTVIFTGLAIVFSQVTFSRTEGYQAVITSASGLRSGDKVRIAGVPVGSVGKVRVGSDNYAHVDFDVEDRYTLLQSTRATVRYENLVGDRYLELLEGPGSLAPLSAGSTIPTERTAPALDLDLLLGGFKPLLQGLDPGQVNDLTAALIQVFQGSGETLVSLFSSTGSFSKTLADRDQLIGSVITNLNQVLATIDARGDQFSSTLDQLQQLVSGLAADRDPIGAALPRLAGATGDLTELLQAARPDLQNDVTQLGKVSTQLDDGNEHIQWVLDQLPGTFRKLVRLGAYGSFFQFYACQTQIKFTVPGAGNLMLKTPGPQTTGRCAP